MFQRMVWFQKIKTTDLNTSLREINPTNFPSLRSLRLAA